MILHDKIIKMNSYKLLLFSILTTLLWSNCETINTDPVFDVVPNIKIIEQSQDTLVEFQDQLLLKIQYEDGDGDIGNADPDINTIFVKDARLSEEDEYYLGPLAPEDAEISITGVLDLQLSATFLFGNGTQETTIFSIYLVDRAGNISNTIQTGEILIVRQ